jgi:hypothetical protein
MPAERIQEVPLVIKGSYIEFRNSASPDVAPSGRTRLYWSPDDSQMKVSVDGGDYAPLILGDLSSDVTIRTGQTIESDGEEYDGTGSSYQIIGVDLNLAAGAGSDTLTNPKFLAPIMGNVLGADLTEAANYLAGVIGAYSITGAKATEYPAAPIIGILFDGAQADALVLAVLDGDDGGAATNARAAFGVAINNNNTSSGVQYGVDLYAAANANYSSGGGFTPQAFVPSIADIRFHNQQVLVALTTAITANSTLTTVPAGSIGITSHATGVGKLFVSDGTKWQFAAVS